MHPTHKTPNSDRAERKKYAVKMTQTTKKRLSKKTKGSWRKIEHKDVDDFLEDQRLEDRIGKVSDKTNDELFEIDTKPQRKKVKKIGLSKLEKRKLLLEQTPKCFASLENESKVTDPISKRNRVRTKDERKHFIAKSIEAANAVKGIVKKKLITSLADRAKSLGTAAEKSSRNKQKVFDNDIWEMGTLRDQRKDFKTEWLDEHVANHNIVNTGTPIVSAHASAYHKRSKLKAIEVPHPGLSYNPTLEAHQQLLQALKERELKIIKQEEHLNRVTTSMFNKMSAVERDIFKLKELRSGIDDDADDDEHEQIHDSNDEDNNEFIAVNPPVEVKKKDRKARRKQKEQRLLKQQLLKKKLEKKKIVDINRVKALKAEIKAAELELQLNRESKKEREAKKREQPHRLSRYAFEEEEIDVNLPEDISGNLRNTVPEGNILKDRFKSMQKRNIVAPSKDLGLRKRREVKRYVRNTHKVEPEQPSKLKKKKK